jgi:hypothetical protein
MSFAFQPNNTATFRFLWPCIVSKVWREKIEQDATIRYLLLTSVSTCFGHHYPIFRRTKTLLLHRNASVLRFRTGWHRGLDVSTCFNFYAQNGSNMHFYAYGTTCMQSRSFFRGLFIKHHNLTTLAQSDLRKHKCGGIENICFFSSQLQIWQFGNCTHNTRIIGHTLSYMCHRYLS